MKRDEPLIHSFSIRSTGFQRTSWQPAVDVYTGREGWLIKFDLAGVRPEDIQILAKGRNLTVSGVRRDWTILEEQRAWSMEIAYNRFERTVRLPCQLEDLNIRSEYRDGMLMIIVTPERPCP
ncbi:Hsp20/alpha crystallin family protein [bacterium]|nr:Hsp20/alpha crystallin family protein [bacterium]